MKILFRCAVLLLVLLPLLAGAAEVPPLKGRINDYAGLLTPAAASRLEQKLASFERETSNQVAVLTVRSLDGDNIDQFAIRVAEAWKLGQKGKDNGVLLVIAQAERKVRIEVGMGLQGVLPDITASKIIRETMRPYLKDANFDQGVGVGVDAIIAATKGEFKASPQDAARRKHKKSSYPVGIIVALVAVVVCGMISRYLGGAAGAVGVPLAASMAFPGLGILSLFLLALAGLVGGFLLSMLLSGMSGGGYGGFGGGYGGGYWGGGYGGGSSGGGDSFSGGGGDFDGGGSSDDY